MNHISSDKKMQLAKMIRDEHQNNRLKMQGREEFLYGKHSYLSTPSAIEPLDNTPNSTTVYSSFPLRFFIAAFLLVGFIIWDNNQTTVMGTSSDEIYTLIKDEDVLTNIIDFMGNITYTQESVKTNALESQKD